MDGTLQAQSTGAGRVRIYTHTLTVPREDLLRKPWYSPVGVAFTHEHLAFYLNRFNYSGELALNGSRHGIDAPSMALAGKIFFTDVYGSKKHGIKPKDPNTIVAEFVKALESLEHGVIGISDNGLSESVKSKGLDALAGMTEDEARFLFVQFGVSERTTIRQFLDLVDRLGIKPVHYYSHESQR